MKYKKTVNVYNFLISSLVISCSCLMVANIIHVIFCLNINKIDVLFIVSTGFYIVGILCLIFLIKKIFHWFYNKMVPIVEDAEWLSQGGATSKRKAYNSLKIAIIVIFLIDVIFQIITLCV